MRAKIYFSLMANIALLAVLLVCGIGLFFVRTKKIPHITDLELAISAHEANQDIISGQYLILLNKKLAPNLEKILEPLNLEPILPLLNWTLVAKKHTHNFKRISLNSAQAEEDQLILNSLLEHPSVLDAQHNFVLEAATLPTNQDLAHDWHLQSREAEEVALNMPKAWELSSGSPQVRVAVVDDFIYKNSFSFADRFRDCLSRVNFLEPFGRLQQSATIPHGELMLIALGACNNQPHLSSGMDSRARLLAVERSSMGHAQTMAAALYAGGINICEHSLVPCKKELKLSVPSPKADVILLPFANSAPDLLQFFSDMLLALTKENIIVVAASGNNRANASNFFPGRAPGLINVGALNRSGQRAGFSNWGPCVDMLAPGERINFIYPSLSKTVAGSSLSAAYVAGSISLMKAINPSITWKSARYFLASAASPLSCHDYCLKEKSSTEKIGCATLCCDSTENRCGSLAVDTARALDLAKKQQIHRGLLELDKSYLIFTRNNVNPEKVLVRNIGDVPAEVEARVFDDTISVDPPNFSLTPRTGDKDHILVEIGFKKEPFARQTFKVEFVVKNNNIIEDRSELFIEYIPKSGRLELEHP